MGAGVAWGHHVGLQQSAFQVDVVVTQSLVDGSQHLEQSRAKMDWGGAGGKVGTGVSPKALAPGRHLTFSVTY